MKSNKKNRLIPLFAVAIFLAISGFLALNWLSSPADQKKQEKVSFSIQKGQSLDQIINDLKEKELIRSKAAMKLTILRLGLAKKIQAGEFLISPSWNLKEIAQTLTVGRSDVKVTLIEGWRREEIADQLASQFNNPGDLFDKDDFLKITENSEGRLFPDTYFIPKQSTAEEIASMLSNNFSKKVNNQLRSQIEEQTLSLEQALIIASLVEREAKLLKDRTLVAGVLIKRWRNNWGLEVDATVQYALGFQKTSKSWWKQELTLKDLKINSPYNTYLNPGLPPTPICNPSFASIQAVANQKQSPFWFYISDTKGNLHFAETLEEHNLNIAKYLNK